MLLVCQVEVLADSFKVHFDWDLREGCGLVHRPGSKRLQNRKGGSLGSVERAHHDDFPGK